MAKTAKRHIGDLGEEVACKYLVNKGFSIISRNYLKPWGEIDIVAKKGNKLRFVEVKTASVAAAGDKRGVTRETSGGRAGYRPEENVHPAKLKRLHRAVQTYLMDHNVSQETDWQIDVACVYLNHATHKARVELLENIIL